MIWIQRTLELAARRRGFHLVTSEIERALPEMRRLACGLLHVFIQHTSASVTISENADPDVPADLEHFFNALVPEAFPFAHTCEGPDDMPAHVKSALLGSSVTIPITAGSLALGVWQGVYLCEHRNRAGRRRLVLTLCGSSEVDQETG